MTTIIHAISPVQLRLHLNTKIKLKAGKTMKGFQCVGSLISNVVIDNLPELL